MRAIIADHSGGPEVLRLLDVPELEAGPGEILVETLAVGLNFIEIYQRSGVYRVDFPFTPGSEAAGRVVAVGEGVTSLAVGDRIMTSEASRTYAERFIVREAGAMRVPDSLADVLSDAQAAALPLQGLTAHYLANSSAHPEEGDTVLVHAGAGGVGLILTQLLAAKGVRVIATASTPEKRALCVEAGAVEAIEYEGFGDRTCELTRGIGVSVVYDGVGKDTFDESLASLAVRGTMVLFGGSSGPVPEFDLQRLNAGGSLSITRPSLGHFLRTPEERAWRYGELFEAIESGALKISVGATFPLAEAAAAHEALAGRGTTGKVVLIP